MAGLEVYLLVLQAMIAGSGMNEYSTNVVLESYRTGSGVVD